MNHKQKIGYILLGAFIMLIGMSIDNLTSTPVTAQNDGEITCQKLTFVDETGKPLFILQAKTEGVSDHQLSIRNKAGQEAVRLTSRISERPELTVNSVDLFGNVGNEGKVAVALTSRDLLHGPKVEIYDENGQLCIHLAGTSSSDPLSPRVDFWNKQRILCASIGANAHGNGYLFRRSDSEVNQ